MRGSKIAYGKLETVSSSCQRASAVRRGAHYDRTGGQFREVFRNGGFQPQNFRNGKRAAAGSHRYVVVGDVLRLAHKKAGMRLSHPGF